MRLREHRVSILFVVFQISVLKKADSGPDAPCELKQRPRVERGYNVTSILRVRARGDHDTRSKSWSHGHLTTRSVALRTWGRVVAVKTTASMRCVGMPYSRGGTHLFSCVLTCLICRGGNLFPDTHQGSVRDKCLRIEILVTRAMELVSLGQ